MQQCLCFLLKKARTGSSTGGSVVESAISTSVDCGCVGASPFVSVVSVSWVSSAGLGDGSAISKNYFPVVLSTDWRVMKRSEGVDRAVCRSGSQC